MRPLYLSLLALFLVPTLYAQPQVLLSKMLGVTQQVTQGRYGYTLTATSPDTTVSAEGAVQFRRVKGGAADRPMALVRVENPDGTTVFTPDAGAWMYSARTGKTYVDETGAELEDTLYPHFLNPLVWSIGAMLPLMAADSLWTEDDATCTFVRSTFSQVEDVAGLDFCVDEAGYPKAYELHARLDEGIATIRVDLVGLDLETSVTDDAFAQPADAPLVPLGDDAPSLLLASGTAAPAFALPDAAGTAVALSDYAGKVVVLDFWGVWCPTCVEALPEMQALQDEFGDALAVLGVSCYEDEATDPTAFARTRGVTYPILLGGEAIADAYGVTAFPTYYVIGKDGGVRFAAAPDETPGTDAMLVAAVRAALAE